MPHERDDHFILEVADDPRTKGKTLRATTPSDVMTIHDVEELKAQLQFYSRPLISSVVPDSVKARKHYVEKVRPALRYYCKKFGVEVPSWLSSDDRFHDMSEGEKRNLFGTHVLSRREFRPLRKPKKPGSVSKVR